MLTKYFRYLWIGQALANFGDVYYVVALISLVYQATDSALFTSFVPVMFVVAQFISGMLAPLLIDRYRLTDLLVFSQLGKTILLLFMTLFSTFLVSKGMLAFAFALAFLLAFLDGWATPARNALIPRIVSENGLVKANSLMSTADQSVQFIGWASGGMLVAWLGGQYVLGGTVGLYLLSTLLMLFIRDTEREKTEREKKSGWKSMREGWEKIGKTPLLRTITIVDILECFAGGVWISAITLVYVSEVLIQGDEWWGFINASYMAGMIAGGILVLAVEKKLDGYLLRVFFCATLCAGLITFAFGLTAMPVLALALSFMLGPFHQLQFIAKQTVLQTTVEMKLLPKVFAAKDTLEGLVFGLSVVVMSFLADTWGVTSVYRVAAVLSAVAALLIFAHAKKEKRNKSCEEQCR